MYTKKYLTPNAFNDGVTFEQYCARIPEFYFKKEVPQDIKDSFEVIEKLLAHSYFEYKFIDEAYKKAILTFEMAMRMNFKPTEPTKRKPAFKELLDKLYPLNVFDTSYEVLDNLRKLRNIYSHPDQHMFGGIIVWNRIESISFLINELYEDVELRMERKKLGTDFIEGLKERQLKNHLMLQHGNGALIFFEIHLIFINNKNQPNTYALYCVPIFDLTVGENGSMKVPDSRMLKIINPVFTANSLTAQDFYTKETITFSSINMNPIVKRKFEEWFEKFNKLEKINQVLFSSNSMNHVRKVLDSETREFQRM